MRNSKPILLVDDDRADAMMVRRAFRELEVTNPLVNPNNGEEALEYLRDDGNKKPCVILLDSNMPKMNSIDFLRIIKANEALKEIPVVVLTTSKNNQHARESLNLGATGHIVKPADWENLAETIRVIDSYWTLSELPNES